MPATSKKTTRTRKTKPTCKTDREDEPFAESMGYQVRLTYRMFERFIQDRLTQSQIQIGMWYFLRILWREDGLTQRELSRRAGTAEPTTLEQLRHMETRGLIKRRRGVDDKRTVLVVLTAKGRLLENALMKNLDDLHAVALAGLSPSDIVTLRELLTRVRENLKAAKRKV